MEQALQKFLKVAEDGGKFMNDLDRMFQDMGIKPNNRDSTSSSEDTPAATPTTGIKTSWCYRFFSGIRSPLHI